jgi:hypothetical protein
MKQIEAKLAIREENQSHNPQLMDRLDTIEQFLAEIAKRPANT